MHSIDFSTNCPGCLGTGTAQVHVATERMYGMGGRFEYIECPDCQTLRLNCLPDLSGFYPTGYYHEATADQPWIRQLVSRAQAFIASTASAGLLQRLLVRMRYHLAKDAAVLDVGCGTGTLLKGMRNLGYRNLRGVDPFIETDISEPVEIHKSTISELTGSFDFIMLNHSLEHIPECEDVLREAAKRLAPRGRLLVRIPVVNYAWQRYGTRWVQLDAPRHVVLFSENGFRTLARRVGLMVDKVEYDSTPFQIWGSELYEQDLVLKDHYPKDFLAFALVRLKMLLKFHKQVKVLNESRRGDQVAFLLSLPGSAAA